MEGVMDMLAERIGVDGWDIRERNILNPGGRPRDRTDHAESVRGIRETLHAVKDVYKRAKVQGHRLRDQEHGSWKRHDRRRLHRHSRRRRTTAEILNGYTEMGQGVYTATMQAVCEETDLPAEIMSVVWDKTLGEKCGETWASRGTTLSCAAAQHAARKLAAELDSLPLTREPVDRTPDPMLRVRQLDQLVGREYRGEYVCNFTTRPGTPEAVLNPTTHLTFSYAAQVVILDEQGQAQRVVVANDVGRAINPRLCAEQMEGGVHMGLGYALSERLSFDRGCP
jgi:xanthine dehydrogenase molybdenum-binding subunit